MQAALWCLEKAVLELNNEEEKFVLIIDLSDFAMANIDTKWCVRPCGFFALQQDALHHFSWLNFLYQYPRQYIHRRAHKKIA
jgi:hypothetical protein